jgi:hypothetical protein
MSDEIIDSIAWHCGNSDGCKQGWHQGNYWSYDDGTYSYDSHASGDHEDIGEEDLPTTEEIQESWRKYAAWVVEHGEDPLNNFLIDREKKVKERWTVSFRMSIGGWIAREMTHAKFTQRATVIPKDVALYFGLFRSTIVGPWRLPEDMGLTVFKVKEFCKDTPGCKVTGNGYQMKISALVPRTLPRSEKQVRRELIRVARKAAKSKIIGIETKE